MRSVGLLGRLFAILLATVVVEFGVSTLLYEQTSRSLVREDEARRLAEHLSIARRLIAEQPPADRPRMAERLTTPRYLVAWTPTPPPAIPAGARRMTELARQVTAWEPSLARGAFEIALTGGRRAALVGSVRVGNGGWLRFSAAAPADLWRSVANRIVQVLLPAAIVFLLAVLLFRQTLRPMRMLAVAAERIGRGGGVRLPEAGPGEVRRLIRAFNAMQERIRQLIDDRTQALAAVGHDLRTPLARLQLRTDAIADPPLRHAIGEDVGEMAAMLSSLLAYLGGDSDPERAVRSDVAVLVATLVDAAQDRGGDAIYEGPDHIEAVVRALNLKRALGNLIENAIHYGGNARVSLERGGGLLRFVVEDDGPGIPPDRIESALQPFSRLDPARGRNTSGLGLGLAIVQRAAELEGGTLILTNRASGGLRAELRMLERLEQFPTS